MRPYESLRSRREFALALRRGTAFSTNALRIHQFVPRGRAGKPKVGLIVTKKVGGAVVRNRIRRRCKSVLDALLKETRGRWLVVSCSPRAAQLPFGELRDQLTRAVERFENKKGRDA